MHPLLQVYKYRVSLFQDVSPNSHALELVWQPLPPCIDFVEDCLDNSSQCFIVGVLHVDGCSWHTLLLNLVAFLQLEQTLSLDQYLILFLLGIPRQTQPLNEGIHHACIGFLAALPILLVCRGVIETQQTLSVVVGEPSVVIVLYLSDKRPDLLLVLPIAENIVKFRIHVIAVFIQF